jgi:opacity protein-like surface antigen
MKRIFFARLLGLTVVAVVMLSIGHSDAFGGGKLGLYGIRMVPRGADAEDYSRPGWGGGFHVVVPVPQLSNVLAGVAGFEIINLLHETVEFHDHVTGLRVEQQTSQDYFRVYLGPQIGGHGNAVLRPHAGLNLALVFYNIGTDVVVPDDYDRENEIRQKLHSEHNTVFGYDVTLGMDLNFSNKVALDSGVRYVKSFSLPQQLGEGSVKVHPQYFQIYFGVGVSFETLKKLKSKEEV